MHTPVVSDATTITYGSVMLPSLILVLTLVDFLWQELDLYILHSHMRDLCTEMYPLLFCNIGFFDTCSHFQIAGFSAKRGLNSWFVPTNTHTHTHTHTHHTTHTHTHTHTHCYYTPIMHGATVTIILLTAPQY